MNTKETINQEVNEQTVLNDTDVNSSCQNNTSDTMTDDDTPQTDTMTEQTTEDKSAEEQIDWKDKYIRLQAEFDNFRKRTLREKMDLIQSGGSDVLKAILPILDDMQRAIAASEQSDDIAALREGVPHYY